VLRRNAAKMDGRTLELANAPELGEESIAEQTERDFEAGHAGILFSARRPSALPEVEAEDDVLRGLLGEVYAGAPWVDLERLLREGSRHALGRDGALLLQPPSRRLDGSGGTCALGFSRGS
jgi:hypothetical protein